MSLQETFIPVRPSGTSFPKWVVDAQQEGRYRVVDASNVVDALREIVESDFVFWDTEYKDTPAGQIVSAFSFSTKVGTGWLYPIGMHHIPNMSLDIAKKFMVAIRSKPNGAQNCRSEYRSVKSTWPDEWESLVDITHDIQVLWYIREPNEAKDFKEKGARRRGSGMPAGFSQSAMALQYLKLETAELDKKTFWDAGHQFAELAPDVATQYACCDADSGLRLFLKGADPAIINSDSYKLDMAILRPLMDMEDLGMWFDEDRLEEIEKETRPVVEDAKIEAYARLKTTPEAVNIDSSTQLRRHLYLTLGWPIRGKKTKDNLGSTDAMTMERFAESSDPEIALAAQAYSNYKKWFTLHNNFLTKLHEYKNVHTGAIHCSLLSTVVPTGRLACASPNLQQIPRKRKDGRAPLRRAFRARPGKLFVAADYSQIELRVYAGETKENYFFESFANGTDLHLKTASIIFREPITDKKDDRRQMGKTCNFGPIYGLMAQGLESRTDFTLSEAEQILDDMWAAMPDAAQWTKECHAKAKKMGGVHTHFGRWRPLAQWLNSRIPYEVAFGERSAVNTIVQGTAADIMRIAIVRIWRALRDPNCPFDAQMVLTIHDSVMFEVAEATDLAAFYDWLKRLMCFEIPGYPPLEIDMEFGRNWHEMAEFKPEAEEPLIVPTAESFIEQTKEIVLPWMTEHQNGQLLQFITSHRVKDGASPGLTVLVNFKRDGQLITPVPIRFGMPAYQALLQHIVQVARANLTEKSADDVPVVQFA